MGFEIKNTITGRILANPSDMQVCLPHLRTDLSVVHEPMDVNDQSREDRLTILQLGKVLTPKPTHPVVWDRHR